MIERLFTNAAAVDGRMTHIAVAEGRIVSIGPDLPETGEVDVVDLQGWVVLPGFVDGHIHLDKSFLGDSWRPHQPANSLRERLAIEKQALAQAKPMAERAEALLAQAAAFGTIAMRSHVDVDATTGLTNLRTIMQVREQWRDRMHIELVAFPQAGVMSCPGTVQVLEDAAREGVDVIGGIDPTTLDGDADGQLNAVFGIAEKHGVKIDIHLHEPGMQGVEQLHRIAARTRAAGLNDRVAVSHAYSLGDVPPEVLDRIAMALADAGVAIMTNAPGNRAFPPVLRLREAGVNVFSGNDNIQDAWWPYGSGDMLQRAMLVGYRSGFYTDESLHTALHLISSAGAAVLGLSGYGLAVGNDATFVAVKAPNAAAAVAAAPAERRVIRKGRV